MMGTWKKNSIDTAWRGSDRLPPSISVGYFGLVKTDRKAGELEEILSPIPYSPISPTLGRAIAPISGIEKHH